MTSIFIDLKKRDIEDLKTTKSAMKDRGPWNEDEANRPSPAEYRRRYNEHHADDEPEPEPETPKEGES